MHVLYKQIYLKNVSWKSFLISLKASLLIEGHQVILFFFYNYFFIKTVFILRSNLIKIIITNIHNRGRYCPTSNP